MKLDGAVKGILFPEDGFYEPYPLPKEWIKFLDRSSWVCIFFGIDVTCFMLKIYFFILIYDQEFNNLT